MAVKIPERTPQPGGFYYHYKHDPNGTVNNYAYEVLGVGFHTEDDCRPGEEHFVIYRPLYEASVYKASQELGIPCFDTRPLAMWMGEVEKGDTILPRFSLITNQQTISELVKIRDEMY